MVKELVRYLLENMYLDFQGEILGHRAAVAAHGRQPRRRGSYSEAHRGQGCRRALADLRRRTQGPSADWSERRGRSRAAAALFGELIAITAALSACDQGKQDDEQPAVGPPVHVIATNIGGGTLPANGRIELAFDRLLLPLSILRQTFILQDTHGGSLAPSIAYDPVARVVTITPTDALVQGVNYQLTIASPSSPTDTNGLRAIDGAHLASSSQSQSFFTFTAGPPGTAPALRRSTSVTISLECWPRSAASRFATELRAP